ncbi:hypothetical protein ANO14919_126130 [Xylariales sp. No.14919]|nr:hypothetical protein ANO14919_126130 [Xylariales sp. No.14919]
MEHFRDLTPIMSSPNALGGTVIATGNSAQDSIQNNGFMVIYRTSSGDQELLGTLDYCDFAPILEERQRKRTPDTCRWITEGPEFRRWRSEEHVLWIFGMPGSGKSFISHYLYEHLVDEGQVPLHFFFDSKSAAAKDLNSLKKFYPTILHQLLRRASRKPDITRKKCFDISRQRLSDGDASSAALRKAIRDVLVILGSTYLVIDSVDECTDVDDEALEAWLGEIKQLPGVQTVVTSRSSQKLDTLAKRAECINLNLSSHIARSNQDIRLFIKHRLQKSVNPQFSGMGEVAEQVAEKSKGMILYARLMLDILERTPGDKEAYKRKLNRLPTGLSGLYAAKLSEIVNFDEVTEFVKSILRWLITCRRPPTIETLWGVDAIRSAVERTPTRISTADFTHFLRQHCLPLVEVLDDNTVRFVHTTVAQFLKGEDIEGEGETCPERFQIKVLDGHEHITIVSLTLLSWNIAREKAASLDYKDLQEYAILEWPIHFKQSAKQIMKDEEKRNLILSFCRHENFWPWLTARAASDVTFRIYFVVVVVVVVVIVVIFNVMRGPP